MLQRVLGAKTAHSLLSLNCAAHARQNTLISHGVGRRHFSLELEGSIQFEILQKQLLFLLLHLLVQ